MREQPRILNPFDHEIRHLLQRIPLQLESGNGPLIANFVT
jgi:hypothetical protein